MSDREKLLADCAARLRQMASDLEDADELAPDEVTCHRELGGRMTQAERRLRALASDLAGR